MAEDAGALVAARAPSVAEGAEGFPDPSEAEPEGSSTNPDEGEPASDEEAAAPSARREPRLPDKP